MFGLRALTKAIASLTTSVLGLAGTIDSVNAELRQRAALDEPAEVPALQLPIAASTASPGDAATTDDTTTAPMPTVGRNGRSRRTTATAEQ